MFGRMKNKRLEKELRIRRFEAKKGKKWKGKWEDWERTRSFTGTMLQLMNLVLVGSTKLLLFLDR